jgi:hypothetical protein
MAITNNKISINKPPIFWWFTPPIYGNFGDGLLHSRVIKHGSWKFPKKLRVAGKSTINGRLSIAMFDFQRVLVMSYLIAIKESAWPFSLVLNVGNGGMIYNNKYLHKNHFIPPFLKISKYFWTPRNSSQLARKMQSSLVQLLAEKQRHCNSHHLLAFRWKLDIVSAQNGYWWIETPVPSCTPGEHQQNWWMEDKISPNWMFLVGVDSSPWKSSFPGWNMLKYHLELRNVCFLRCELGPLGHP